MPALVLALTVTLVLAVPSAGQDAKHVGKTLAAWQSELQSARQVDRMLAARAIGEMAIANQAGASKALVQALSHDDSAVRYWGAVAAAELDRQLEVGRAVLEGLLEDEAPEVRIQAAVALIRAGDAQKALKTLEESLRHRNRGVRLHAAHAADAIGDSAKPLASALQAAVEDDFDYVQRVGRHALWALGERPCPYRTCEETEQGR